MDTGALSPGVGYQGKGPALAHSGSWPGYSRSRPIRYDSPLYVFRGLVPDNNCQLPLSKVHLGAGGQREQSSRRE